MGVGLAVMILIPNPIWGRLTFFACGAVLLLIGVLLKKSAGTENLKTSTIS